MTDLTAISSASSGNRNVTSQTNTESRGNALASDFETFLQMLTAQARYQDPLEPLDSSEYASQLAQFSSVEQQVQTNDLLKDLASQFSSNNMAQFAGWIGMDARTSAHVHFDQSPLTLSPQPAEIAEEAHIVVYDAANVEVQRLLIPLDGEDVQWAGVDELGDPFQAGKYRFEIESFANDGLVAQERLETYSKVVETRLEAGQTVLVLEGGTTVSTGEVTALRQND